MANIGEVSLKVTLSKENISNEAFKIFKDYQAEVDKNIITYKIAGDKSNLDSMLKQIQGMTPELLTKLKLDFNKSDYDTEMKALKNTTGKTADQIGMDFKKKIEQSLEGFDVSQVIGKKLKKNDLLNERDVKKVKDVITSLRQQTEGFDFTKVTSVKQIEEQTIALSKLLTLYDALSKHTKQKSVRMDDGVTLNFQDEINKLTNGVEDSEGKLVYGINNIMEKAGSVIHTNASKWMTSLENTFNTEYGAIVSMFENLTRIMQGVFDGTVTGGGSGGNGTSKAFDDLEKEITEVTNKIKEAEAELEKLNKEKTKMESSTPDPALESQIKDKSRAISTYRARNLNALNSGNEEAINGFKKIVDDYMLLGGKLEGVGNEGVKKLIEKFNIKQIVPDTSNITKQIEEVTAKLNQLKATRDNLIAQQAQMSNSSIGNGGQGSGDGQGTGTGTGVGTSTPTTATVSPKLSEDFKAKLQEQVTNIGSVDATISGKLTETFKEDVQTNVTNLGTVNMGVSFTDQSKEGEKKQEIPVDVVATPKLSDTFRDDLQKKVDDLGTYDVKVNLKDTSKDNNPDDKDNATLINVKPNNIEDFKSQLKSGVEGTDGLDIKIRPIIADDFNLEIKNATLKDVKVEGNITGGNYQPASVEAPTTPSSTVEPPSAQSESVKKELKEVKQGHEEVGKAAEKSSEVQKRSLLEVAKEISKTRTELDKWKSKADSSKSSDEMSQFIAKKKQQAQEYSNIQELITKIQSKSAESSSDSAKNTDKIKHLAGIVAYVERLQKLMGNAFSYNVLGENGEERFKLMKQVVDDASGSVDTAVKKVRELNLQVNSLQTEQSVLGKTATDAEKLEVQLYETAKSFKSNGTAINITTDKFKNFLRLWKQYKDIKGTKNFSEFTDNAKLISAVTKEYNKLIEVKAKEKQESMRRKAAVGSMYAKQEQPLYSEKYSDIDKTQFDNLINKLKQGALTAGEFDAEIVKIRESLKTLGKESGIPTAQGQALKTPQPSTKLGVSGEINVVPKVEDPTAFVTGVSSQIGSNSAEINITPKIENPVDFANRVTEQLKGVSAEISVKPNVDFGKDQTNIKNEISSLLEQYNAISKEYQSNYKGDFFQKLPSVDFDIPDNEQINQLKLYINAYKQFKNAFKNNNDQLINIEANNPISKIYDAGIFRVTQDNIEQTKQKIVSLMIHLDELGIKYDGLFDKTRTKEIMPTYNKAVTSMKEYKAEADRICESNAKVDESMSKIAEQIRSLLGISLKENGVDKMLDVSQIISKVSAKNVLGENTDYNNIAETLMKYYQGSSTQPIPIPLEADIQSLNTSIQSKKDQILPVDVKLNGVLASTSTDTNVGTTGMTSEIQQAETLRQKITEVTTAVDAKTNAFRQEEQVVIGTVQREISNLEALDGQLYIILQTIQKIQAIPITLNVKVSEDFYNSESHVNSIIEELKTSLSGIDSAMLQNLTSVLQALSIKDTTVKNVQRLANAVLNLKSNLNNVSSGGTQFLNDIKELNSQASNLKDIAAVIRASKEEIQKAKDVIAETKAKESPANIQATEIAQGTKEWTKIEEAASRYKDTLGEIQKITYSMRQDKDGKELKSYRITGSKSSVTLGENLNKVAESETKIYQKTAQEMNKIRNDFIQAANKSNLNFNLDSLKIDKNGVITFTTTISEMGKEAVTTKYKIDDLYATLEKGVRNNGEVALNTNGTLNKKYLNKNVYGSITSKDLTGEYTEADKEALITAYQQSEEYQKRQNEYIKERNRLVAEGKAQEEEYYKLQYSNVLAQAYTDADKNIQAENEYLKERNRLLAEGKAQERAYYKQQEKNNKNAKYNEITGLYHDELEKAFKDKFIGDAKFLEVSSVKSNGNATIKFIEQIGNQARTSTLFIKDMEAALNEINSGTFNLSDNNYSFGTGKWKTVDNVATPSTKDVDPVIEAYTHLISTEEKYQKLRAKIENNTASKQQIEDFNVLTALREKDNNILEQTTVLTEKQMQLQRAYQKEVEKANITYGVVLTHGGGTRVENIDKAQEEAIRINNALTKTQQLMSQFSNSNVKGFDQVFERAKNQVDELNKKLIAGDISNIQTGYEDKINKIVASLKNVVAVTLPGDIETAKAKMIELASSLNNGKVTIGNFTNNNKVLNASFEQQKGVIKEVALVYDELSGSIRLVEKGTKRVNTFWQSFGKGLKQRYSSLAQYLLTFVSFYRVWGTIKQGITYIKEFDTALVEMRKVSDETVASLKNFQAESFNIAKSVGTTAKQIQESTADFMRLGESLDEASKSAEVANILLNVSEFESIDDATDSLVAMSSAYSELDKIDIVDKLNEVGNNYAISTDGIASALQKSASALKTAGNDMDEAIALVTAGNAVVQDPDSVGAAMRTIALRLTGTKEASDELSELGEDTEGVVTTVSKLRDTIMSATKVASNGFKGFDILDENGNYKSTYEILKGISQVYQEIVETDKKTGSNNINLLLETIAGKNRANVAASILQSPEVLADAYNSSANESQGSAQEELEKYLDSIEGKMQNFKNEVQEFWHNLISSETVKGFVDFGTKAIDLIGKITDKIGLLGTTIISIITLPKLKNLLLGKDLSGGRVKQRYLEIYERYIKIYKIILNNFIKSALTNMPPNRLAERCARY